MKILAIDPGYDRMGVAILEKTTGKETVVFSDCLETSKKQTHAERLLFIGQCLEEILITHLPYAVAVEKLFFTNNQKTALLVAEVRGIILYLAQKHNCKIYEYTPNQIKVAVTGNGNSTKKEIIIMIPRLVSFTKEKARDDEYDAIACGLTCFASERFPHNIM